VPQAATPPQTWQVASHVIAEEQHLAALASQLKGQEALLKEEKAAHAVGRQRLQQLQMTEAGDAARHATMQAAIQQRRAQLADATRALDTSELALAALWAHGAALWRALTGAPRDGGGTGGGGGGGGTGGAGGAGGASAAESPRSPRSPRSDGAAGAGGAGGAGGRGGVGGRGGERAEIEIEIKALLASGRGQGGAGEGEDGGWGGGGREGWAEEAVAAVAALHRLVHSDDTVPATLCARGCNPMRVTTARGGRGLLLTTGGLPLTGQGGRGAKNRRTSRRSEGQARCRRIGHCPLA